MSTETSFSDTIKKPSTFAYEMYCFCVAIFLASAGFAQDFTLGGLKGNTIFIGVDNALELGDSLRQEVTRIESLGPVSVKKQAEIFYLSAMKPSEQIKLRLYSDSDKLIDSISLKAERISFRQFVKVQNSGLSVSGEYSRATLQNLESVIVKLNVPWIGTPVLMFKVEVYQDELLYSGVHRGARLDDPGIQTSISKLTRGGVVRVIGIRAALPGDDGPQPKSMRFICK